MVEQLIIAIGKWTIMVFLWTILIKNRTKHYFGIAVNNVKQFYVRVDHCDRGIGHLTIVIIQWINGIVDCIIVKKQ